MRRRPGRRGRRRRRPVNWQSRPGQTGSAGPARRPPCRPPSPDSLARADERRHRLHPGRRGRRRRGRGGGGGGGGGGYGGPVWGETFTGRWRARGKTGGTAGSVATADRAGLAAAAAGPSNSPPRGISPSERSRLSRPRWPAACTRPAIAVSAGIGQRVRRRSRDAVLWGHGREGRAGGRGGDRRLRSAGRLRRRRRRRSIWVEASALDLSQATLNVSGGARPSNLANSGGGGRVILEYNTITGPTVTGAASQLTNSGPREATPTRAWR